MSLGLFFARGECHCCELIFIRWSAPVVFLVLDHFVAVELFGAIAVLRSLW